MRNNHDSTRVIILRRQMMIFDKSKVCVAGLHDDHVGTKGYCANTIAQLENYVTTENKQMEGIVHGAQDGYYSVRGKGYSFYGVMFYPAQEKKYRPFETIEEARVLIGRVLRHKLLKRLILVTVVEYCDTVIGDEFVCINGERASKILDKYIIDETGEPVGVEV